MEPYACLESRMFSAYTLQAAPRFVPDLACGVPVASQRQLYQLTRDLYALAAESPELLCKALNPDDAHPNRFHLSSYGKPELVVRMRRALSALNDLLAALYALAAAGQLVEGCLQLPAGYAIARKQVQRLALAGLDVAGNRVSSARYPQVFSALHWAATRAQGSLAKLVRCQYDDCYPYQLDVFRQYAGDAAAFDRLVSWLQAHGYRYEPFPDAGTRSFELSALGFFKPITADYAPTPWMYDKTLIGLCVEFQALAQPPVAFALRVQGVRPLLPRFATLAAPVQRLIATYHGRCGGCGYCTQRNRARGQQARPYTVLVEYEGQALALCPISHRYSYSWPQLDEALVDGMIAYLELMEREYDL